MALAISFGILAGLIVVRYVVLPRLDPRRPAYVWVAFAWAFVPAGAVLLTAANATRTQPVAAVALAAVGFAYLTFLIVTLRRLSRDPAEAAALMDLLSGRSQRLTPRWRAVTLLVVVVSVITLLVTVLLRPT